MTDIEFLFRVLLETLTLFFMLVGLVGLLIPIFPGLVVMWLATLFYALIQASIQSMTWFEWVLFAMITLLMIAGSIVDNIIIANRVRERQVPWGSIIIGYLAGIIASIFFTPLIGIFAAPAGLFGAEYLRLRDTRVAFASTRAWMTGWGVTIAVRIAIGVVMIGLWMLWAWL
ncbi:MAG: DUF456 domain-containing protein [Anaerolineales bacterium]